MSTAHLTLFFFLNVISVFVGQPRMVVVVRTQVRCHDFGVVELPYASAFE